MPMQLRCLSHNLGTYAHVHAYRTCMMHSHSLRSTPPSRTHNPTWIMAFRNVQAGFLHCPIIHNNTTNWPPMQVAICEDVPDSHVPSKLWTPALAQAESRSQAQAQAMSDVSPKLYSDQSSGVTLSLSRTNMRWLSAQVSDVRML